MENEIIKKFENKYFLLQKQLDEANYLNNGIINIINKLENFIGFFYFEI